MNQTATDIQNTKTTVENLKRTLLYEGYSLFPYHRTALKNIKPIPFGVVYPKDYAQHHQQVSPLMQTECVVKGNEQAGLDVKVYFLQLIKKETGWKAIEREVHSDELKLNELKKEKEFPFEFNNSPDSRSSEEGWGEAIKGILSIKAIPLPSGFKLTATITNQTPVKNPESISRDEILYQSFLSTHTLLTVKNGKFISDQNPDEEWKPLIQQTQKIGSWPILIDDEDSVMLSSPIILYDHPKINEKSKGDLFDSTEIEEALLLHVNLLSAHEKLEIAQSDEKLNAMMKKVSEVTPEEMINLHGGMQEVKTEKQNK